MYKIYFLKNTGLTKEEESFLISLCPKEKKEELLKKEIKNKREQSILGICLLRYALNDFFDIPYNEHRISYEKNKKPYYLGKEGVYFNISHSADGVVCVVSDKTVGIDIEKERKVNFNSLKVFGYSAKTNEEFFEKWTKCEAVLKKDGIGIKNMQKPDISNTKTIKFEKYYISIAF